MAIRAYYLKKIHEFSYEKFVAKLAGTYILNFFVVGVLGIMSSIYIRFVMERSNFTIDLMFGGLFFATTICLFGSSWIPKFETGFLGKVYNGVLTWNEIARDRVVVAKLIAIAFMNVVLNSLIFFYALRAVGYKSDFFGLFYMSVLESLSIFIKLTPGNMGISEAMMVWSGSVIEISPAIILSAAVLVRISLYVSVGLLLPLAVHRLFGPNWRDVMALNELKKEQV